MTSLISLLSSVLEAAILQRVSLDSTVTVSYKGVTEATEAFTPQPQNNTVVISKKVVKSAVRRNYIRRRIYEIIRLELPTLKDNYDVAVMVFSAEAYSADHQELTTLIKSLLSQATLYK